MHIDRVHIVLLKFALVFVVHVKYTFPGDATGFEENGVRRGNGSGSTCFVLNYVRLCMKHRANRSRRDIERRRRQRARINCNFSHRRLVSSAVQSAPAIAFRSIILLRICYVVSLVRSTADFLPVSHLTQFHHVINSQNRIGEANAHRNHLLRWFH